MCGNGLYFSVIFGLLLSPLTAVIIYKLGDRLFFRHLPERQRDNQLTYWLYASVVLAIALPISALFAPDPELDAYKARIAERKVKTLIHRLQLSPEDNKVCGEGAVSGRGPVGQVVVCTHEVAIGDAIKSEDLMVAPVDAGRIPQKTLNNTTEAIGHKSKYGLSRGQIVSDFDIVP